MGVDGLHMVYKKKHHMSMAARPKARTGFAIAMIWAVFATIGGA
jgi:hypothetical protein